MRRHDRPRRLRLDSYAHSAGWSRPSVRRFSSWCCGPFLSWCRTLVVSSGMARAFVLHYREMGRDRPANRGEMRKIWRKSGDDTGCADCAASSTRWRSHRAEDRRSFLDGWDSHSGARGEPGVAGAESSTPRKETTVTTLESLATPGQFSLTPGQPCPPGPPATRNGSDFQVWRPRTPGVSRSNRAPVDDRSEQLWGLFWMTSESR